MAITIKDLQPREVWKHFEALTQVPRPSGHLEKIQQFLLDFGKSINVKTWQDEAGNIIMRKPATPGLENRKGIILQAHMDMVPQKTPDSKHDFINDPITTIVKGDWLYADDTTLGADNGLGVAAIMAIMEDESLQHGPLEALITADEETGMYGAFGLKGGELEGELLLNLDSEEEGVLYIGCAGGLDITATMEFMEEASDEEDVAVKVHSKACAADTQVLKSMQVVAMPTSLWHALYARLWTSAVLFLQAGTAVTCATQSLLVAKWYSHSLPKALRS